MKRYLMVVMALFPILAHSATEQVSTSTEQSPKEAIFGNTTANVSLTSDFIFRGQTQTNHLPAIQGGLDWTHSSGIFLGAWGSNIRLPDAVSTLEIDEYGGYTYAFNSVLSASLGLYYYSFFPGSDTNTLEYPLALSWNNLKLGANYSPHWGGGQAGHAWYLSAGWNTKVWWDTTLGLIAGYSLFGTNTGDLDNYADFHANIARQLIGVNWDVSGYLVNHRQVSGIDDPRVVFTASKAF